MDRTEGIRKVLVHAINVGKNREQLEVDWDTVYNTEEVSKSFSIQGFMAPFVVAACFNMSQDFTGLTVTCKKNKKE